MAEGMYSLLGRATTSDYKRRRDEERDYRRDLRRDQLKASLLGMVLNPIAQQVSTGISEGISSRFADKYSNWQLTTEDAWQYKKDKEQAKTTFEELQAQSKAITEFGGDKKEYYIQNVAPGYLQKNMDEALQQRLGNQLADKNSVYMKGILPALARERIDKGDTAAFDAWSATANAFDDNKIRNPAQLDKFEKLAKKEFPSGLWAGMKNLFTGRSKEDIEKAALQILTENPAIKGLKKATDLLEESRRTNRTNLEAVAQLIDESTIIEKYRKKNIVDEKTETTFDIADRTDPKSKKVLKRKTTSVIAYPAGIVKTREDGTKYIAKQDTKITEEVFDTAEKIEKEFLELLQKNTNFMKAFNSLNEDGKQDYYQAVGGKNAAEKILQSAMTNWSGKSTSQILDEYSKLVDITTIAGNTSDKVDAATQTIINFQATINQTLKQQQQLIKDARLEVERGNYSNITEALNTDTKFVEQWELLQTELGDLFTKRNNAFTDSALLRANLRKDS